MPSKFGGIPVGQAPQKAVAPQQATAATPDYGYGNRSDGTPKGKGYFGELKRPDGDFSTEISIGVDYGNGEKEIPSLVPGLSEEEKTYLLSGGKPTKSIINKAIDHAKMREAKGLSPFAGPDDLPGAQPSTSTAIPAKVSKFGGVPVDAAPVGKGPDPDVPQIGSDGQPIINQPQQQPAPTLGQNLVGAGETALALGTGATGGTVGMAGGTIKGILDELMSGKFGSQEAADRIEKAGADGSSALTYAPRTQAGQEQTQAVGEALAPLAALGPLGNEVGVIVQGAKAAAPLARGVVGDLASKAADLIPARAAKLADDNSVGAAETEAAMQRRTTAGALPVPIKLTKGAETRNPDQLAFEKEQMKTELGQPLRDRAEENNLQLLQNFDSLIDDSGAGAVDVASTGNKVIDTLSQGYKSARARTKKAYDLARSSDESRAPVDLAKKVTLGGDDPDTSLIGYLNSKVSGIPSSAVTDAAKKYAVRMGIAAEDQDGTLSPLPTQVGKLEDFRREMSGIASKTEPGQIRDETIIKKLVDAHTGPVAGPLYNAARAERTKQARKYENRAVVARLLTNKGGSDDPKVAADQVFQKSVINSSPDEINFLRRVMLTSGNGGRQAWKDVQGALVDHIRNESTKGLGTDSSGQPIVSPAKLNQTVSALDKNGRLNVVLGAKNARIVRDLNDVAKYVNTVPPGTLINNSGTAGTILAAMGESALMGLGTGIPAPIFTGLKQISKAIKSQKMKAKIQGALNNMTPEKK